MYSIMVCIIQYVFSMNLKLNIEQEYTVQTGKTWKGYLSRKRRQLRQYFCYLHSIIYLCPAPGSSPQGTSSAREQYGRLARVGMSAKQFLLCYGHSHLLGMSAKQFLLCDGLSQLLALLRFHNQVQGCRRNNFRSATDTSIFLALESEYTVIAKLKLQLGKSAKPSKIAEPRSALHTVQKSRANSC